MCVILINQKLTIITTMLTTEEKLSIIIIRNYHTKYARLSPELLRRICVATQIAKPKNFQISICSQFILDNQITE
jgi:hypothetical protein